MESILKPECTLPIPTCQSIKDINLTRWVVISDKHTTNRKKKTSQTPAYEILPKPNIQLQDGAYEACELTLVQMS